MASHVETKDGMLLKRCNFIVDFLWLCLYLCFLDYKNRNVFFKRNVWKISAKIFQFLAYKFKYFFSFFVINNLFPNITIFITQKITPETNINKILRSIFTILEKYSNLNWRQVLIRVLYKNFSQKKGLDREKHLESRRLHPSPSARSSSTAEEFLPSSFFFFHSAALNRNWR